MKLGVFLSVLIGYVTGQQTYYLGDPLDVSFEPSVFLPDLTVARFYIQLANNETLVNFTNMNYVINHRHHPNNITLYSDFGTVNSMLIATATATGEAKIFGVGGAGKVIHLATVMLARRVTFEGGKGRASMISQLPTFFLVRHNGGMSPVNLSNPSSWIVQLVSAPQGAPSFTQMVSFTTTTVDMVTAGLYGLGGQWVSQNAQPGTGLYLMVGVKNGTNAAFNTYAIISHSLAVQNSWVLVNSSFSLTVPAKVKEYSLTNIMLNGGGVDDYWLLRVTEMSNMTAVLGCQALSASKYGNFEWKVLAMNNDSTYSALQIGTYQIDAVWTGYNSPQMAFNDSFLTNPSISTGKTMIVEPHDSNAKTAITFNGNNAQGLGVLSMNQNVTIGVYSVFKEVYLQWFKYDKNYTNKSNPTNATGWQPVPGVSTVTFNPGQTLNVSMKIPNEVFNVPHDTPHARLYGWSEDCQGRRFASIFAPGNLTFPASGGGGGGSSNKLGAGAIVGIVCAVVFVCGVAAWWVCMKNSSNTDRYQKLDGR